ncbi:DUF5623 domain-containing protein [Calothrix sp. FACHB-1219]|uniref:DUF5623 domain-containing protein n=1 Tax=Calothrix sp. FACHB-1219 TaxID=2692778 RepID=UPI001689BB91|nr:DUF5623 domain-containing protein [Calothrix sp. FACHB-1219]
MLNESIRPKSIVGIKRFAKALKSQRGISHYEALNEAARLAGFENFRHASNKLPAKLTERAAKPVYRLFITASWKDRDSGASGRETAWVDLDVPWSELVTKAQMRAQRSLVRLWEEASDHLSYEYVCGSQAEARRAVCAGLRTFQFMQATRLRPTSAHSRVFPGGSDRNAVPGRDHYGSWYHPESKAYVFADEPYEPAALRRLNERNAWAVKHDYAIAKPDWPGMYNPGGDGGSRLYLIVNKKKAPPIAALVAALNQLPPPLLAEDWKGQSAEGMQRFKSPAELEGGVEQQKAAKVPVKSPKPRAAQVPRQQRPGRMPIEVHEELGRKLKLVLSDTALRDGVHKRVGAIRCELDDWIQREYDYEALPMERFSQVYYGAGPDHVSVPSLSAQRIAEHIGTLHEVKATLEQHYPLTQVKSMLGRIDSAVKSLNSWTQQ